MKALTPCCGGMGRGEWGWQSDCAEALSPIAHFVAHFLRMLTFVRGCRIFQTNDTTIAMKSA
jgi:hypothetical protein